MNTEVIHAREVIKEFKDRSKGTFRAVNQVNLDIKQGEIIALLGPNGAGKSTLIDMILGLTTPTSGTIQAFGSAPRQAIAASKIGAVLQTGGLLGNLTVWETVAMIATTFPNPQLPETVLRRTNLSHLARRRVAKCSGGEQQRLRFALALLPDPDFLILDEPTAGMDAGARHAFWDTMQEQARKGKTILFATHYIEEAQNFAERIVMMRAGRIIADDTTTNVRALVGGRTVSAVFPPDFRTNRIPGLASISMNGNRTVLNTGDSDELLRYLLGHTPATDIMVSESSLEDVFLNLTADEQIDEQVGEQATELAKETES